MSTTEAVAEIFLAGLLATLWLGIACMAVVDPGQTKILVTFFSSTAGLIVLGAFSYQLGWIVNSVTYTLARSTYYRFLIRSAFGYDIDRVEYHRIKLAIYSDAGNELLIRELEQETAIDRVARAGGLNLFMLAVTLLICKPVVLPDTVILGLGVLSALSWRLAFRRKRSYYRMIALAGKHLVQRCDLATEIISTRRLSLRSPIPGDLDILYERVFSDAVVMRFALGGKPMTRGEAAKFFESAFDHDATGLKLGVLVEKASSEIIGFSGLMECKDLEEKDYEIGFVLSRSFWNKGYATEIGRGQLDYGFGTVVCARLLALVHPENKGSIRVLERIGMKKKTDHPELPKSKNRGPRLVYIADRPVE